MKQAIMFGVIVIGSVVVWRLGSRLSADAVGLAVGVLLGVLASIPASLLILASSRRPAAPAEDERWSAPQERMPLYQPPVIILAGQGAPPQQPAPSHASAPPPHGWSQPASARQFKIVGEEEHWLR
ncbi:MAG TPA: hypothetical protein GYA08_05900 [Chloroflexi bacterium]|nr:hypothetical protein [Chloroflexota bacterium]